MDLVERVLVRAHHHRVHLPRVARVAAALAAQMGAARSILDVGCGDGTVARAVADRVGAARVAGVDVQVRPEVAIEVVAYDGRTLPFPDGAFDVVMLSDVLHHCEAPRAVLREALRVASRAVAVKDHFRFGPLSEKILLWMDRAGNHGPAVLVRGTYWSPAEWVEMVAGAGGRFAGLTWPLRIHDYPFRLITQDRLQFAARIEHARGMGQSAAPPRGAPSTNREAR
jgi:SAM-dependent methyltransferase